MKTAPQLMVGLTAAASLAAGVLMTAQDRTPFEARHAMLTELTEQASSTLAPPAAAETRRALARPGELRASDRMPRSPLRSGPLGARERP